MMDLSRPSRPQALEQTSANRKWSVLPFLLFCLALALPASNASAQTAKDGGLVISKPWMRFIIPERPAAGYFVLLNKSGRDRTLTGASSPACKTLMLHESLHRNGVEKMVMVKSIAVPAHGSVAFSPGGYHLMCMSPTRAVKVGARVLVTLDFADGAKLQAPFVVKNAAGK